jgi:peptidoglycan/xylan/chitin deacetylase (PgdA/CDA1 family)
MRLFRPGFLAGWLYPEAIFRIKTTKKVLYLTFDDGPDTVSTPKLLDILKGQNIKALFFCNGMEAEKHYGLISQIRNEGHTVGNHGYSHLDGWRTSCESYLSDIRKASAFTSGKIFRPPFGHLRFSQYRIFKKKIKIVFWDMMPYDFDPTLGSNKSLEILKKKLRPGSIIVMHDKASSCANEILEEYLNFAISEGYRFELLDVAGPPFLHSCCF